MTISMDTFVSAVAILTCIANMFVMFVKLPLRLAIIEKEIKDFREQVFKGMQDRIERLESTIFMTSPTVRKRGQANARV